MRIATFCGLRAGNWCDRGSLLEIVLHRFSGRGAGDAALFERAYCGCTRIFFPFPLSTFKGKFQCFEPFGMHVGFPHFHFRGIFKVISTYFAFRFPLSTQKHGHSLGSRGEDAGDCECQDRAEWRMIVYVVYVYRTPSDSGETWIP